MLGGFQLFKIKIVFVLLRRVLNEEFSHSWDLKPLRLFLRGVLKQSTYNSKSTNIEAGHFHYCVQLLVSAFNLIIIILLRIVLLLEVMDTLKIDVHHNLFPSTHRHY